MEHLKTSAAKNKLIFAFQLLKMVIVIFQSGGSEKRINLF